MQQDEGSTPSISTNIKYPSDGIGIHSGLRNRVERRVSSSLTLGTIQ